jgi:hypothetical protein
MDLIIGDDLVTARTSPSAAGAHQHRPHQANPIGTLSETLLATRAARSTASRS